MPGLPSGPTVLVTRPDPDGAELAADLAALGYSPVLAPLMRIDYHDQPLDLSGLQAVAFTSANGVRAFCRCADVRDLPVFAVGDATARLAMDMGFQRVAVAGGDVDALAALISETAAPASGAIFHGTGSHVAGDLAGQLTKAGFAVVSKKLYTATAADRLTSEARQVLARKTIGAVLLFSPRTANVFQEIVRREGLEQALRQTVAICMSQNVATAIKSLPFRAVHVSSAPTKAGVLEALENSVPPA